MSAIVTARDIHAHVIHTSLPVAAAPWDLQWERKRGREEEKEGDEAFGYLHDRTADERRPRSANESALHDCADKSPYPSIIIVLERARGDDKNYYGVCVIPSENSRDFR